MHKKYNKFLIVSFIGVCIFGVYSYFYNDLKSEAASETDSPLSSSLTDTKTNPIDVNQNNKATEETAFLMKLASLNTIRVNTSLFERESFKFLVDNNITLEPAPFGRINPFAPTGEQAVVNKQTFILKTMPATLIVNKSALLNGSIEGATSNNIYFEYGTTEALGKTTPKVNPSLMGTLAASINLLTPKTTYYYRVAANINGVLSYGEIMSFNIN